MSDTNPTEAFGLKIGDRIEVMGVVGHDIEHVEEWLGQRGRVRGFCTNPDEPRIYIDWDNFSSGINLLPELDMWKRVGENLERSNPAR